MDPQVPPQIEAARSLGRTLSSITALVEGVGDEDARVRHDEDHWSLVEVVGHLLDEEREDFRALRAGDLLLAWVAHDLAHLSQIARWQAEAASARLQPFQDDYAY